MRLRKNLIHDVAIYPVSFIGSAEFEDKSTGRGDQDDLAGLEDHAFICGRNADHLVVRDGDHGLFLCECSLIIENNAAVGDADEASASTFAVIHGHEGFAWNDIGDDAK